MKKLIPLTAIFFAFLPQLTTASPECSFMWKKSNKEKQDYTTYYSKTVESYLTETADGRLMRVEDRGNGTIGVMYFNEQYDCTDTLNVELGLPKFGAFHAGSDGNYYVLTGQDNPEEQDTVEVFRITKYNNNWQLLGYGGLLGANTVEPMRSSATRMTDDGDFLFVRSSHKMYKSEKDGKNHQASVTIQVDKNTMEIVDAQTRVINEGYGYTSHSFDAYLKVDDGHLVVASLGDAYPRGIYLGRCKKKTSEKKVDCAFNYCTVQEIPGKIGQNATGVSMGGMEVSDSAYLFVYNYLDSTISTKQRNIYISAVPRIKEGFGEPVITKITQSEETGIRVHTPKIVEIEANRYLLLWSDDTDKVYYTELDEKGNYGDIYECVGNLSDCQPILYNNKIVWYVAIGKQTPENIVFYEIDPNNLDDIQAKPATFDHDFELVKKDGATFYKCTQCGQEAECSNTLQVAQKTIQPTGYDHTLHLDGYDGDIALYNLKGNLVYQGHNKELRLENGVYLVRWGNERQLVVIR